MTHKELNKLVWSDKAPRWIQVGKMIYHRLGIGYVKVGLEADFDRKLLGIQEVVG